MTRPRSLASEAGEVGASIDCKIASTKAQHLFVKTPPSRSPVCLLQEELGNDPWKLLNRTRGSHASPTIDTLFRLYPTPSALLAADDTQLQELLRPLGLWRKRAASLKRFTHEFLTSNWQYPAELHAVGKYGDDCYRLLCCGETLLQPTDHALKKYLQWRLNPQDNVAEIRSQVDEEHRRTREGVKQRKRTRLTRASPHFTPSSSSSSSPISVSIPLPSSAPSSSFKEGAGTLSQPINLLSDSEEAAAVESEEEDSTAILAPPTNTTHARRSNASRRKSKEEGTEPSSTAAESKWELYRKRLREEDARLVSAMTRKMRRLSR